MKDSAVTHEAQPEQPESAFQRFGKVMRALVAVPKSKLAKELAQERGTRESGGKKQRR